MRVRLWVSGSIMVIALTVLSAGCGKGEKLAQARADSLEAVLQQRMADSLRVAKQHVEDSVRLAKQRVEDSLLAEKMRPRELVLFESTGATVAATKFTEFGFVLDSLGVCSLSGRVEATAGGNKDVQVLVMGEDQFTNWVNNPQGAGTALASNPPQTVTTLNVMLSQPGRFYLVISNRFSMFTPKDVKGEAQVTCRGGVQPRPLT